ncbi:nucleotide exchange factor GrpE [Brevibacterium jeotgali]|uniref:Protein GrpE n=1 Tax=Brevibacterium jeotgali TaxID=1262550 RepID=A0A2H1L1X6_9MICO|nr:nucleotide exchange factor GrpE [Brevibacterium jeotgali]TWC01914.1 molecular chaperone GrpE [Brevibacterium jeotgali]SMY10735.1 molecular chaperone GrpE [Brevibacterium jeotgali]
MTADEGPQDGHTEPGFSFTDKRRVDPETGELRPEAQQAPETDATDAEAPAGTGEQAGEPVPAADAPDGDAPAADLPADDPAQAAGADAADLGIEIPDDASSIDGASLEEPLSADAQLAAERLADLQRINAEYAAYRMRATREQERAKESGVVALAEALIPVLDEARLAEENGDVTGPFEAHVTKLFASLAKAGVVQYGDVGEGFDPAFHEALMQQPSDEVDGPTIFMVMQPGYRYGDRVIRAARVGVQQPAD